MQCGTYGVARKMSYYNIPVHRVLKTGPDIVKHIKEEWKQDTGYAAVKIIYIDRISFW